jgi:hypothetical protein
MPQNEVHAFMHRDVPHHDVKHEGGKLVVVERGGSFEGRNVIERQSARIGAELPRRGRVSFSGYTTSLSFSSGIGRPDARSRRRASRPQALNAIRGTPLKIPAMDLNLVARTRR